MFAGEAARELGLRFIAAENNKIAYESGMSRLEELFQNPTRQAGIHPISLTENEGGSNAVENVAMKENAPKRRSCQQQCTRRRTQFPRASVLVAIFQSEADISNFLYPRYCDIA